jgi:L-2,4-diaminobutyrate decarboxylase
MRVDLLEQTLTSLKSQDRNIVAVVAGACSTPIGAFDPLEKIADVCERHNVWMHVDAAHGGAAALSDTHAHLVAGLARADSVVVDAHKMLFMPALCAFAFYKNKHHRFVAFEQDAPYLFDPTNPGIAEYDSGTQTVECTKRAAAFGLWGMWSLFGRQLFRDLVDVTFAMAQELHQKLVAAEDFEPLHVPECNIQVFRYLPASVRDWSPERIGEFELNLRRAVITSGKAYIVPIKLDGIGALRATVINPCTTSDDLDQVLEAIRKSARRLV